MSSMAAKMELLRFALIDEIEAAGASLLGKLQQHMAEAARRSLFKYKPGRHRVRPRPFGGINFLGFGDLWQLPSPRQISVCSNPNKPSALADHRSRDIMDMFWAPTEEWGFNGLHTFTVSKRLDSGREDAKWFRVITEECREGNLHEENYNFMHGYDTIVTGSWLSTTQMVQCEDEDGKCTRRCALITKPLLTNDDLELLERNEECEQLSLIHI